MPRLRLIQSLWAGVESLLADPTVPADVPLARMVDPAMNEAMAETALWAVLSLQRRCFDYARQQRESRWAPHASAALAKSAVTVLGLGQMGRAVALRLAAQRLPRLRLERAPVRRFPACARWPATRRCRPRSPTRRCS